MTPYERAASTLVAVGLLSWIVGCLYGAAVVWSLQVMR